MAKKATKKETVEEEVKKVETVDMEQKAEQPTNEIKEEVVTETTTDDELVNTETTNEEINESTPSNDLEKVEAKMRQFYTSRGTNINVIMQPYRQMMEQMNSAIETNYWDDVRSKLSD